MPSVAASTRPPRDRSESTVPCPYRQACMDLRERRFLLKATGEAIAVYQGADSAEGMAGLTGGETERVVSICFLRK